VQPYDGGFDFWVGNLGYSEINVMITSTISKEELIKVAESMVAQKATTA